MRKILIAGANSGIAQSLIDLLHRQNHTLFLISRNPDKLKSAGGHSFNDICFQFDFANPSAIKTTLNDFLQEKGPFDGVVYFPGVMKIEKLSKTTPNKILDIFNVNYFSFVELLRCVMLLKPAEHQMRVVALSSALLRTGRYTAAYASSKAALNSFIKSTAFELIKKNCYVNAVCPACVDTSMLDLNCLLDPDFKENIKDSQLLGLIPPEAVAYEINHLLSKPMPYETGTCIEINGGAGL